MRIATILGTRPEIIRLSEVIRRLDECVEHLLIHTGQNFDERLSGLFFRELDLREPDLHLGIRETGFGAQAGAILERTERALESLRPDRVLILGDTNSGLAALPARRLGIPVFHMEAGNRCWDERVPEEMNRRVIDHTSSVLLPYTERSRQNLLAEGIPGHRIFVTGNPIGEVIERHTAAIEASRILEELGLGSGEYFLVTAHRSENVDPPARLQALFAALAAVADEHGLPLIGSLHPRTAARMRELGLDPARAGLTFLPPFGFFDFVKLERHAACVLTDSGTVQEETCLFGTPNVTLRDTTERPETLECGSNILCGVATEAVQAAVALALRQRGAWTAPREYRVRGVADIVSRILVSRWPEMDGGSREARRVEPRGTQPCVSV